jgi:hypothetical protein
MSEPPAKGESWSATSPTILGRYRAVSGLSGGVFALAECGIIDFAECLRLAREDSDITPTHGIRLTSDVISAKRGRAGQDHIDFGLAGGGGQVVISGLALGWLRSVFIIHALKWGKAKRR